MKDSTKILHMMEMMATTAMRAQLQPEYTMLSKHVFRLLQSKTPESYDLIDICRFSMEFTAGDQAEDLYQACLEYTGQKP